MLSVLIKPASSLCNMRCAYCFYHNEAEHRDVAFTGIMTDETVDNLIRKAFAASKDGVFFAFQGGEPTLAGLAFFQRFVRKVDAVNVQGAPVVYTLQTNGLTMNSEWAIFLRDHHFLVGLSCDGDAVLHNELRPDAAGKGTFDRVVAAAKCMQKYGVEFNVLTVVTKQVAKRIKRIYAAFCEQGFQYMQFIPCIAPLGEEAYSAFVPSDAEYYTFLHRLFVVWHSDFERGKYRSIRYFDNLYHIYKGYGAEQCGMQGHCNIQFVIEGNGDVYPCDFYCLDDFLLGNINKMTFAELAASENAKSFVGVSYAQSEKCKACAYAKYCCNGCRRYRENGEFRYCEASRKFYAEFVEQLPEIDRMLKSGLVQF